MLQMISDVFNGFRLKRKIKRGESLTALDAIKIACSPKLSAELAALEEQVVVTLPKFLVVRGLETLSFDQSVRLHCNENMVVSTKKRLHFNPKAMKTRQFVSSGEINLYDKFLVDEMERRGLIDVIDAPEPLLPDRRNCHCDGCNKKRD